MEETVGCTDTGTGVLFTPPAVAVTLAVPVAGLLHTRKLASHTPAQTRPLVETVTRLVFEEEKVMVERTTVFAEFSADALIWATSPGTSESEAGPTLTWVTVLLGFALPPPQPARKAAKKQMIADLPTQDCMPPPRPAPASPWRPPLAGSGVRRPEAEC